MTNRFESAGAATERAADAAMAVSALGSAGLPPAGPNPEIGKQIVIAGGCARSGTTALGALINLHPDCAMSHERYFRFYKKGPLTPDLFTHERMRDPEPGDSLFERVKLQKPDVVASFQTASIVGDKYPALYRAYDNIFASLAGVKIIYILRNPISVIKSFDVRAERTRAGTAASKWSAQRDMTAGMREWNDSVRATLEAKRRYGDRVGVFTYEHLHFSKAACDRMFEFLGVEPISEAAYQKQLRPDLQESNFSKDMLRYAFRNADSESYRALGDLALDRDV